MIKINLITVGKLKEKYWRDAVAEYSKRLSAFCKLEIVELNESKLPDDPSDKQKLSALESEAKAILPYLEIKRLRVSILVTSLYLRIITIAPPTIKF